MERIEPEIFGLVSADSLRFFALYQRYDTLGQAIAQSSSAFTPACLTHNNLKLNNILLHINWQESTNSIVRLIDWGAVLLIVITYTCAAIKGKVFRSSKQQNYVSRLIKMKHSLTKNSSFWVGLDGNNWIIGMEIFSIGLNN